MSAKIDFENALYELEHQHQNQDLHHHRDLIVEQLQGLFLGRSILT